MAINGVVAKKKPRRVCLGCDFGGERGIRTPGSVTFSGFQDRRNRPLCHLSGCGFVRFWSNAGANIEAILASANSGVALFAGVRKKEILKKITFFFIFTLFNV